LYGNKKKWKKMHVLDGNGSFQERIIGKKDSKKDSIRKLFINNSRDIVKVVATVVIYVDGEKYVHNRELATNFMANHRSITDLEMLSDFTIVCGGKQFKCHRLILASMSTIFKTMLTNNNFTENTEHMTRLRTLSKLCFTS
jgi:predicted ATP-dependent Lon-type protease